MALFDCISLLLGSVGHSALCLWVPWPGRAALGRNASLVLGSVRPAMAAALRAGRNGAGRGRTAEHGNGESESRSAAAPHWPGPPGPPLGPPARRDALDALKAGRDGPPACVATRGPRTAIAANLCGSLAGPAGLAGPRDQRPAAALRGQAPPAGVEAGGVLVCSHTSIKRKPTAISAWPALQRRDHQPPARPPRGQSRHGHRWADATPRGPRTRA